MAIIKVVEEKVVIVKVGVQGPEGAQGAQGTPGEGDMLKSVYDINDNGVVDVAEGVEIVAGLPAPVAGARLLCKNSEIYLDI